MRSANVPLPRINYLYVLALPSPCRTPAFLCGPKRSRMFALIAFEPVGHPKQRAEDRGAVVAGQVHDTGFNNEAAEFDEMPGALAALDLPRAHVMSHPCGLMPVARRSVAQERHPCCGQLLP
jgi:hypothetical protein